MGKLQNRQKSGHQAPGTRGLLLACPERWLGDAAAGQRWGIGVLTEVLGCRHCLELSIQQECRGRLRLLCTARKTGPLIPEGSDLPVFPAVRNLDPVRILHRAHCAAWRCARCLRSMDPRCSRSCWKAGKMLFVGQPSTFLPQLPALRSFPAHEELPGCFPTDGKHQTCAPTLSSSSHPKKWLLPGAQPCTSERDGSGQCLWFAAAELSQSCCAVTWWKP